MGQSCSAHVLKAEVVAPGADGSCLAPAPCLPEEGAWPGNLEAPCVPLSAENFAIVRHNKGSRGGGSSSSDSSAGGVREDWRRRYTPRTELGHGVSAKVYEAETSADACGSPDSWGILGGGVLPDPHLLCGSRPSGSCLRDTRRRVALKRFKRLRSRSFQTERAALQRVGVHPNVVRLLESYEDFGGEDVLVLEYCDGCTVFDVQAESRKTGGILPELLAVRLLRQVLLALEHINACGVEHQDVKPENLLLYDVSLAEERAHLKLGDFGWAAPIRSPPPGSGVAAVGLCSQPEQLPQDGAGSLWYAAPELNPPVKADPPGCAGTATLGSRSPWSSGRADMWSVGIVAYVLLVGQNPFAAALDAKDRKDVEAAVIRLVASGSYDRADKKWCALPEDARSFIEALLQVQAASRLPPAGALRHPFLVKRCARCPETARPDPPWRQPKNASGAWSRLDGFQHLCWLAIARAVTEPELELEMVQSASGSSRTSGAGPMSYLWHLAREISSVPMTCWLRSRGAWSEVLRLAFSYLDVDGDGLLSAKDLASHVSVRDGKGHADAWSAANFWIARWSQSFEDEPGESACASLDTECFRIALRTAPQDISTVLDCTELPDGLDVIAEGGDLRTWDGS